LKTVFKRLLYGAQNVSQVADAPTPAHGARGTLAVAPANVALRIVSIGAGSAHVDGAVSAWLAAVGLAADEVVTILRRAPFGGPLHLRSAAGAELAVAREIALAIDVEAAP